MRRQVLARPQHLRQKTPGVIMYYPQSVSRVDGVSLWWRVDETCIRVNGDWKWLFRAGDKQGRTIDFLLTHRRNAKTRSTISARFRIPALPTVRYEKKQAMPDADKE
jgi:DDE domain